MTQRLDYASHAPDAARAYFAFSQTLDGNGQDKLLHELVNLRASQMNGCAFCTDMHVKAARIAGERELKLHHVAVWRDSPLFDDRERAALEWTEALTDLASGGIADALYDRVRSVLGEALLVRISFMAVAINGWNRLGVAFRPVPGSADEMLGLTNSGLG